MAHLIDDETVAKMGHPILMEKLDLGHPPAFDRLAAGADKELLDDLRDMPFGSYGHLADKFGVHWFFREEKKEA